MEKKEQELNKVMIINLFSTVSTLIQTEKDLGEYVPKGLTEVLKIIKPLCIDILNGTTSNRESIKDFKKKLYLYFKNYLLDIIIDSAKEINNKEELKPEDMLSLLEIYRKIIIYKSN